MLQLYLQYLLFGREASCNPLQKDREKARLLMANAMKANALAVANQFAQDMRPPPNNVL